MDQMTEGMHRLLSVRGFGQGRINLLVEKLGGWDELSRMLREGDVESISSVDRISEKMAVGLILAYRGQDTGDMLGTEGSISIYDGILEVLRSYMHTSTGRNRTSLLVPCGDLGQRQEDSKAFRRMRELLEGVDRREVGSCLAMVGKGRARVKQPGLDYILLVEDDECYQRIRDTGLDRKCLVVSPEDLEENMEGELILVYGNREIDETIIPIAGSVHFSEKTERIVPESVMDLYSGREDQLKALSRLEEIYSRDGHARSALEKLEEMKRVSSSSGDPDEVEGIVEDIRKEIEESLKKDIEALTLTGEDTLSLLSSKEPFALKEIYMEHSRRAAELVYSRLGQRRDLFTISYPLKVDEEALTRMKRDIKEEASGEKFRMKQNMASDLASVWPKVKEGINWALDLDFRFGMGSFVTDLDLHPFEKVDGWFGIFDACHLHLREKKGSQMISYHLGEVPGYAGAMFPFRELTDSRTSLLTGANSGGKTTLLETITQVVIMARMGLPVPAGRSYVPDISRVFYYRPRRRLDAGGLESFLKELLPLVLDVDQGSLVLADELEAMTELDAASRVIGVFIKDLQKRDTYSVVVTHMAREILRFVDSRVDGIEASGLDEGHDLVVDRTPRIGKHARSTPELILKKLQMRSSGEEREIYSRVLSMFDP